MALAHHDFRLRVREVAGAQELLETLRDAAGAPALTSDSVHASEQSAARLATRVAVLEEAARQAAEAARGSAAKLEEERLRLTVENARLAEETHRLQERFQGLEGEVACMQGTRAWKLRDVWVGLRSHILRDG